MTDPNCPSCGGLGWVCENHPDKAWTEKEGGCQCGAGMPCACNKTEDEGILDVEGIIEEIGGNPMRSD
ncbi:MULTISPECIES: hypothetical protein [unclassified Bradyrhizobium]|uniref:hypothetical protein n=1 Tax=unclassified Bradyrhizobium TaxID=2631580 RepID=UPI0020B2D152|nr:MULTISPECIES: hypothetical protein [unclassified Bradyrhizobium]MCP3401844.1 hypothetical protein [Bradyrhizobium sp. CCGB20]MCP3410328.1 hypothetical protein [Bradyrhizobium sp. CCGB01]